MPRNYIITEAILQTLLKGENLVVIDGGSGGGSLLAWYLLGPRLVRYGFDYDEEDCQARNEHAKKFGLPHFYYPICLAKEKEEKRKFYLTNHGGSNSLYPPDERIIERWKQLIDGEPKCSLTTLGLNTVIEVKTTSLDTWAKEENVKDIDFIKLDVQGAELEVLLGGKELLQTAVGVLAEVWYTTVYKEIPLFADIDTFLRKQGFTFFSHYIYTTSQYAGRMASPITAVEKVESPAEQRSAGQLFTTDALYLRDPLNYRGSEDQECFHLSKILKLACIAEMCNQFEYCFELLNFVIAIFSRNGDTIRMKLAREIFEQSSKVYEISGLMDSPAANPAL